MLTTWTVQLLLPLVLRDMPIGNLQLWQNMAAYHVSGWDVDSQVLDVLIYASLNNF